MRAPRMQFEVASLSRCPEVAVRMRVPRVLFEVASLEREAGLQHEACLRHLAAAVRVSHKVHAFAGGFEPEQSQLFDKVQPLNPKSNSSSTS